MGSTAELQQRNNAQSKWNVCILGASGAIEILRAQNNDDVSASVCIYTGFPFAFANPSEMWRRKKFCFFFFSFFLRFSLRAIFWAWTALSV